MEHEQRMRPHVSTTLFALSHLLGIVVTLRFLAFTCGNIAARCQDPAFLAMLAARPCTYRPLSIAVRQPVPTREATPKNTRAVLSLQKY